MGISNFPAEWARWGPDRTSTDVPSPDAAARYCRELTRRTYENFSVATWLLPRSLRQDFYNVYAYCRWADDLADEAATPQVALERLDWWQRELDQMFAGHATHPVFVALSQTIRARRCPKEPFANLLAAFRRDQIQTRYATFDDLLTYCQHSANPVGRIVLHLGEAATPENVALSDSICTGLQLINFCQDVARDWRLGRIYLPIDDLRRHGIEENTSAWGSDSPSFKAMLAEQVARAESFLRRGAPLIETVGPTLSKQVDIFVAGGMAIAAAIRKIDFAVWRQRPTVGKWTKLWIVWQAWTSSPSRRRIRRESRLPALSPTNEPASEVRP